MGILGENGEKIPGNPKKIQRKSQKPQSKENLIPKTPSCPREDQHDAVTQREEDEGLKAMPESSLRGKTS